MKGWASLQHRRCSSCSHAVEQGQSPIEKCVRQREWINERELLPVSRGLHIGNHQRTSVDDADIRWQLLKPDLKFLCTTVRLRI